MFRGRILLCLSLVVQFVFYQIAVFFTHFIKVYQHSLLYIVTCRAERTSNIQCELLFLALGHDLKQVARLDILIIPVAMIKAIKGFW